VESPGGKVVSHPVDDGGEDSLLGANVQLTVGDQLANLLEGQQQELLGAHHLLEVLQGVLVGSRVELLAGVGVREASDAQAVGRVKLAQQELAARIPHGVHLQQSGGRQKHLHVLLGDRDLAGVGVVDQLPQR